MFVIAPAAPLAPSNWLLQVAETWKRAGDQAEGPRRTAAVAAATAAATAAVSLVVEPAQPGDVVARQPGAAAVVVDAEVHQGIAQRLVGLAGVLARVPEAEGVTGLVREELLDGLARVGGALEEAGDTVVEDDVGALDADEGLAVEATGGVGVVPGSADRQRAAGRATEVALDVVVRVFEQQHVLAVEVVEAGGQTGGAAEGET